MQARMTQRELAEPRYTKAYISALEKGLIKPSLAALRYLARRLGTVPEAFLADPDTQWQRIDAELRLAAGDWQSAADRFRAILETEIGGRRTGSLAAGPRRGVIPARAGPGGDPSRDGGAAAPRRRRTGRRRPAGRPTGSRPATTPTDDPARARMLYEELLAQRRIRGGPGAAGPRPDRPRDGRDERG